MAKLNTLNIAYANQNVKTEVLHGSRNHVILSDTVKITFNLDVESTGKTICIV